MTLWKLASSSLLVASSTSFVLPPRITFQQVPSKITTAAALVGSCRGTGDSGCESHVCGQRARPRRRAGTSPLSPTAAAATATAAAARSCRRVSATHHTTFSRLGARADGDSEVEIDDVEEWDGTMQQRQQQQQQRQQPSAAASDFDDGFASLDDLLGLDDSASSREAHTTGEGVSGDVDIDPFASLEDGAPVITDSLDDLLSELQQPSPASSAVPAADTQFSAQGTGTASRRPPASAGAAETEMGETKVSDSWLDDLLDLENEDLDVAASSRDGGNNPVAPGDSSPSSGSILESLIDDMVVERNAPHAASVAGSTAGGPSLPKGKSVPPSPPASAATSTASADTTAALDDWLNELLDDSSNQSSSSNPKTPTTDQPASSTPTVSVAAASLEDDPWNLQAVGDESEQSDAEDDVADGYGGDVITGSNQLEGWKTNTADVSVAALKRSNVMGRARGTGMGTNSDSGGGSAPAWEKSSEEEGQRGSDWGAGEAWTGEGGSSGPSWWDKDGPGLGMEGIAGQQRGFYGFDAPERGRRVLDPIEEAQRACAADLKKLGQRGEWEDATRALVGARVRGIPINVFMYNSAISAVSKAGRWKEALSMMKQMEEDGVAFDKFTYSGAIVACGKGGKPRKALQLLDEMVDMHGIEPDMICYGAAIQACGNAGMSKEALAVMERMSSEGIFPDKTAYNSAIISCGEKGQWEKALELLGEMRSAGLRPDQNSYRFAMKACGAGGRWERALVLLHEMEEDGSTPDSAAFLTALETLRDAAQWEKALDLISEMDELGVPPTEECFSAAIAACAEVGEYREALKARKLMGYYGLQPELTTYKSIIKACLVAKELDVALTTLFDIQRSGRRADQETWDMLVEICAVVGKWDAALEIIREMFAEEVWFDMTTIRSRFFDCPSEDIKMKALTTIAMEARAAPSMRRKKLNNIRAAEKRKAGRRSLATDTRKKNSKDASPTRGRKRGAGSSSKSGGVPR